MFSVLARRHHYFALVLLQQAPLFPAFCMKNGELSVNFGALPFQHAPAGFTGVLAACRLGCLRLLA